MRSVSPLVPVTRIGIASVRPVNVNVQFALSVALSTYEVRIVSRSAGITLTFHMPDMLATDEAGAAGVATAVSTAGASALLHPTAITEQTIILLGLGQCQRCGEALDGVTRRHPRPTLQTADVAVIEIRPLRKLALGDAAGLSHRLQQTTEIRTNVSHRRSYLCLGRWGPARLVAYESTCGQLVDCIVTGDCR